MNQVTVSKDELREILYEYVKTDKSVFSNLMGDFSKKMDKMNDKMDTMDRKVDLHTFQLNTQNQSITDISTNVKNLTDTIGTVKERQDISNGEKRATVGIISIILVIFSSLIGVIWYSQSSRIDKVEAKVFPSQS